MKIKQAEALCGITAKNIRFYEEQGLLNPSRNRENSYRDYGDEDIRTLKVIKVLRKLDIPLENIREVLSGNQPLTQVVVQHINFLEVSINNLEAAKTLCQEIAKRQPEIETLDADACLERIATLEKQGETFANIYDDFKLVVTAIEKMRFHLFPDELVTTPAEFTEALLQYAKEQKLNMIITKESMYPEFTIDGVEYTAMRYTYRFGSAISVEAKEPDSLMPKHIPHQRRYIMEWLWRIGFPLLVAAIIAAIVGGGIILSVVSRN